MTARQCHVVIVPEVVDADLLNCEQFCVRFFATAKAHQGEGSRRSCSQGQQISDAERASGDLDDSLTLGKRLGRAVEFREERPLGTSG